MLVVPLLSGLSGKGIRRTTIISGAVALVGVGLLESGGSASFDTGDLWNFASAIAFGIQVCMVFGGLISEYGHHMACMTCHMIFTSLACSM